MRQTPFLSCAALLIVVAAVFPGPGRDEPNDPAAALRQPRRLSPEDLDPFRRTRSATSIRGSGSSTAFNHDEAQRAFEAAARLDPACAICFWGVALTLGPNINLPAIPDRAARPSSRRNRSRRLAEGEPARRARAHRGAREALLEPVRRRDPGGQKRLDERVRGRDARRLAPVPERPRRRHALRRGA